jgi:hypothetical protein
VAPFGVYGTLRGVWHFWCVTLRYLALLVCDIAVSGTFGV